MSIGSLDSARSQSWGDPIHGGMTGVFVIVRCVGMTSIRIGLWGHHPTAALATRSMCARHGRIRLTVLRKYICIVRTIRAASLMGMRTSPTRARSYGSRRFICRVRRDGCSWGLLRFALSRFKIFALRIAWSRALSRLRRFSMEAINRTPSNRLLSSGTRSMRSLRRSNAIKNHWL